MMTVRYHDRVQLLRGIDSRIELDWRVIDYYERSSNAKLYPFIEACKLREIHRATKNEFAGSRDVKQKTTKHFKYMPRRQNKNR
jgi:hypothetical protein